MPSCPCTRASSPVHPRLRTHTPHPTPPHRIAPHHTAPFSPTHSAHMASANRGGPFRTDGSISHPPRTSLLSRLPCALVSGTPASSWPLKDRRRLALRLGQPLEADSTACGCAQLCGWAVGRGHSLTLFCSRRLVFAC